MMTTLTEALATAKPMKGTRYSLGSYIPVVGNGRRIYVLVLDGVVVNRGSRAELTMIAKSPAGETRFDREHARYDAIVAAAK